MQLFERLDQLLTHSRVLWQFQPFHFTESCWKNSHPSLHQQLIETQIYRHPEHQSQTAKADFLKPWVSESTELVELCELDNLSDQNCVIDAALSYAIDGRKWQQIQQFSSCVDPNAEHIVEWCAGKGHLGRVLSNVKRKIDSVEWQLPLCQEGQRLAARVGVAQQFHHHDVLNEDCRYLLHANTDAVALHACGELHHRLLHDAVAKNIRGLCLSPCCYHLTHADYYQSFSDLAKASTLNLSKQDLKLPLRETVTAEKRVRELRTIEVVWRLGFDSLQRTLRGLNQYLPLPTIPRALLKTDFYQFCLWACEQKQLKLPDSFSREQFEQIGRLRHEDVLQMEYVQHFFQRPLEIWLLLDKVLYLQQHGYKVEMGTFCDYAQTPRNLMIRASR